MPVPSSLYIRLAGEVRGPFTSDLLGELAHSGVIVPSTDAAASPAGPWIPLGQVEACADLFPVRPALQLGAKEFTPVNRPGGEPVDIHQWLKLNQTHERAAGMDDLRAAPPRSNRRRRDYWMVIVGGNLLILLGLGWLAGPLLAVMLAAVYTVSVTWVMFAVMDRY